MGQGSPCPVCDRWYRPPSCACGYEEPPRLTNVAPKKRRTDEASFLTPAREALERLDPEVRAAHRRGIADARAALARATERKGLRAGWMRPVENVDAGGRL